MPPDQIVAAAGADRDDDLYRTVGIPGLRRYRRNAKGESHKCRGDPCQRAAKSKHRISPAGSAVAATLFLAGPTMRHGAGGGNAGPAWLLRHNLTRYGNRS